MGARVFILDIHDPMPNTFASKFKQGRKCPALQVSSLGATNEAQPLPTRSLRFMIRSKISSRHGMLPASIKVIANFANDDLFTLRDLVQFDGRLRFSFHGTILERYGLRNVMHALAGMQNQDRITVKIIGEGDFSAGQGIDRFHATERRGGVR